MPTPDDETLIRELEGIYAAIEHDLQRGDLDAIARRLETGYVAIGPDGTAVDREEILAGMRDMIGNLSDIRWPRRITGLVRDGDEVVVTADGEFSGVATGADGAAQRLQHHTRAQ